MKNNLELSVETIAKEMLSNLSKQKLFNGIEIYYEDIVIGDGKVFKSILPAGTNLLLSVDDYSKKYIQPCANRMADKINKDRGERNIVTFFSIVLEEGIKGVETQYQGFSVCVHKVFNINFKKEFIHIAIGVKFVKPYYAIVYSGMECPILGFKDSTNEGKRPDTGRI